MPSIKQKPSSWLVALAGHAWRGEADVRLVPHAPKGKRRFGALKRRIVVDGDILDPLPEAELALWEGKAG